MTNNVPSGAIKHRESTEPKSRQSPLMWKDMYIELFYAIIPTLFLCFMLICYPYILLYFNAFYSCIKRNDTGHGICYSYRTFRCLRRVTSTQCTQECRSAYHLLTYWVKTLAWMVKQSGLVKSVLPNKLVLHGPE